MADFIDEHFIFIHVTDPQPQEPPMTTPPVRTAQTTSPPEAVAPYLPENYSAEPVPGGSGTLIVGRDVAGWTLDDYVIPRLASGLIFARETEEQS